MILYATKIFLSAILILVISELSKRTGFWGALLASLPLVSLISIGWIYFETRDIEKIRSFSYGIFWLVLPSLAFFLILPACLQKLSFLASFAIAVFSTLALYAVMLWTLPKIGIKL